jgi:hypothetical protein
MAPITKQSPQAPLKQTTVTLWLRVENNSKFVRGKSRARVNIEEFHLKRYGMKKLSEVEYELKFSYEDEARLDKQIYDLLEEIAGEADCRSCFIETDVQEQGTDRSW